MSMFCFQCQEASKNTGCTKKGVCGKTEEVAGLQDLLVYVDKGISVWGKKLQDQNDFNRNAAVFVVKSLFATITNANFDDKRFVDLIKEALRIRDELRDRYVSAYKEKTGEDFSEHMHDCATWFSDDINEFHAKSKLVGVQSTENEDIRSLRELAIYGTKGLAAYVEHAYVLGHEKDNLLGFFFEALESTTRDLSVDELIALVMKTGEMGVNGMALLDKANTETYGHPELSEVQLGVRNNPGILISGHDLRDMEDLLKQTDGTGIDVYTHSEMLPAHYYPGFKKYEHFVGNYGSSWWAQNKDFESFNGPILMTTNCITPVQDSYKGRFFTTGQAGYPDVKHIPDRPEGGAKDFSEIIELAKKCKAPVELETGTIVGGFAHNQVLALADKVIDAVKTGAIKRFIVMAGCDGRHKSRQYYTDVAENLPTDTVILTAGCAKYRYNKLNLGDIGGIPRILDAGQCNDSYSLAVIALKLKEVFKLDDINELPISYDIAWYEQKAVIVLLALLSLGVKNIILGPTIPAFLSPNVVNVLVENFGIRGIDTVEKDIKVLAQA